MSDRKNVTLLDGGMGQELRLRCNQGDTSLWSAQVMLDRPELVREVHEDYIRAGADVITTNSYATVRKRLQDIAGLGREFERLVTLSGQLAVDARDKSEREVLIAGALPPLNGSYRPDRVGRTEDILPIYREHCELLAPFVDVFLCETMSSAAEGYAAAKAAATVGKPIWVAWTLVDDGGALLRSGESLNDAWAALSELPIAAVLANCCAPESVTAAMPKLTALGAKHTGGYANGFKAIPDKWTVNDDGVAALGRRDDLHPDDYLDHVRQWLNAGATIVGGCCEVGPAHIARINDHLRTM